MRQELFITAFLVSTLFATAMHAAAVRTVALSGQPAAGTPAGVNFSSFGAYFANLSSGIFRGPVINDAGQAAFRANLTGSGVDATNNQGVWSEGAGSLALVARTGSAPPGCSTGSALTKSDPSPDFLRKSEDSRCNPTVNGALFFGHSSVEVQP